jgi:hypothetical protein
VSIYSGRGGISADVIWREKYEKGGATKWKMGRKKERRQNMKVKMTFKG